MNHAALNSTKTTSAGILSVSATAWPQKYAPTVQVSDLDTLRTFRPGQWIARDGARGQYLGLTRAGVIVVRWQPGTFGAKRDTRNNRTLRTYAKDYGSR
jgi:hypothetical protein